jgi:hypothetical protein
VPINIACDFSIWVRYTYDLVNIWAKQYVYHIEILIALVYGTHVDSISFSDMGSWWDNIGLSPVCP